MQIHEILDEARNLADWIVDIRRTLHQYPELGYEEVQTSQFIRERLDELHIEYRHPVAGTGVVATLGSGAGPTVALRADMDALPIQEESGVPFCSTAPGRMHACGHDCHVAMLLGAARLLKRREQDIRGTIKLLFQPAEEGGAGGRRMCEEAVLESPAVQRIFGLHVWPFLPIGQVGGRPGAFLAATGSLEIVVTGKGGHAGMPHLVTDPVITAAKVACELQTIASREVDPLVPAVVSITALNGGSTFNVIPSEVRMLGTVRSLTGSGLVFLKQRVREIAVNVAAANRCEAQVAFPGNDYPPLVNDGRCWTLAAETARALLGQNSVQEAPPLMGGEDFAFYTERVPGCFMALGVGNQEKGATYGLHHPRFQVDEEALPIGTALHVGFAFRSLNELRGSS